MRLICPNCGAQYEVPDEVIPSGGRDVQCSNCGDTWFQQHPDQATAPSGDEDFGLPEPEPEAEPEPQTASPEPEPEAEPGPEPRPEALQDRIAQDDDPTVMDDDRPELQAASEPSSPEPAPARRGVDPEVADILRSEAERERKARATAAPGGLETQPDLGLADGTHSDDERSRQARTRMQRLRGTTQSVDETDADEADPEIDPSSRRNLFPDIEEINYSLSATEDRPAPEQAPNTEPTDLPAARGGFGRGFRIALLTFALAALIYVLAPQIADLIPAAKAPLAQYVESVNLARIWLDQSIEKAMGWATGAAEPDAG